MNNTNDLNDILIECCKMRGCYPLLHRTLNEFDWFIDKVIFGKTSLYQDSPNKSMYEQIYDRWNHIYSEETPDDKMLIELAKAFHQYCYEIYARDYDVK